MIYVILKIFIGILISYPAVTTCACFNDAQNRELCTLAKRVAILPASLQQFALQASSLLLGSVSEILDGAVRTAIFQVSPCPINITNDKTIADVFSFRIYDTNGVLKQNATGLELMTMCRKPGTGTPPSYTVYLWQGWLGGCTGNFPKNWGDDIAPYMARKLNAMVIVVDLSKKGANCCFFPTLVYCYIDALTQWMGQRIIECSDNGVTSPIPFTILIGHSLGGQYSGYTGQYVKAQTNTKLYSIIGMDPAGPFFESQDSDGRCQGINSDSAEQTFMFPTNPARLGTNKYDTVDTVIFSEKQKAFCQPNTLCESGLCHGFAVEPLVKLLARDVNLKAMFLNGSNAMADVTIYGSMQRGWYDMESTDNPPLVNPLDYY